MRTRWMATAVMAVAGLTTATADLAAQGSPLAGSWTLDAERSENPMEAFAAARGGAGGAAAMRSGGGGGGGGNVVMRRGGAGGVIMATVQGGQRLRIELTAEHVTIHLDDAAPLTVPLDGSATATTRWDEQVQVRARLAADTLTIETTTAANTIVKEVFSPAADGELTAELHVPLPMMGGQGQQQTVVIRRVYTSASR